jgi:mannosyltransferase
MLLIIVLGAAAWLRCYHLALPSLWHDEAFSWRLVQHTWSEIAPLTAQDFHPPLYYFILKGWVTLVGDSVVAMRSLSALFGIATVLAIFGFAREAYRKDTGQEAARPKMASELGLFAAALAGLSLLQVEHAREVRMYPLGSLLAVLSSWALLRALLKDTGSRLMWAAYAALACALAYTHNYGLFTVAAQALFALGFLVCEARRRRLALFRLSQFRWAAVALLGIALVYGPWLPTLLRQRSQAVTAFWTPPLSPSSVLSALDQTFTDRFNSAYSATGAASGVIWVTVLAGLLMRGRAVDIYVALLAALPLVLGLAVSLVQERNIVVGRYLFFSFPFFLLALARLVEGIPRPRSRTLLATLVLFSFAALDCLFLRQNSAAPGLRGAAEKIVQGWQHGDLVLTVGVGELLATGYYTHPRIRPLLVCEDGTRPKCYQGKVIIEEDECLQAGVLRRQSITRAWLILDESSITGRTFIPERWKLLRSWAFAETAPFRGGKVYLELWQGGTSAPSVRESGLEWMESLLSLHDEEPRHG